MLIFTFFFKEKNQKKQPNHLVAIFFENRTEQKKIPNRIIKQQRQQQQRQQNKIIYLDLLTREKTNSNYDR